MNLVYLVSVTALELTFRWERTTGQMEVHRGHWKTLSPSSSSLIATYATSDHSWTDVLDMYREVNRYLKHKHASWSQQHGPLRPAAAPPS